MRQPEEASMADAIQHVLVRQTEMVSADGCQYFSCAKYSFKRKKKQQQDFFYFIYVFVNPN